SAKETATDERDRARNAAAVLSEIMQMSETGIPKKDYGLAKLWVLSSEFKEVKVMNKFFILSLVCISSGLMLVACQREQGVQGGKRFHSKPCRERGIGNHGSVARRERREDGNPHQCDTGRHVEEYAEGREGKDQGDLLANFGDCIIASFRFLDLKSRNFGDAISNFSALLHGARGRREAVFGVLQDPADHPAVIVDVADDMVQSREAVQ